MKYLRKFIALILFAAFLASAVISVGMIFAVKNINVTLLTYSEDSSESYAELKASLNVFKGESILFIGSDDIVKAIEDSNYTVASSEKIFPCTINVTLRERLETFAISVGGQFSMYDSDGKYLRRDDENRNVNDGSPNVELTGVAVEEIGEIAEIAAIFKEKFSSLRSIVSSITLEANKNIEGYVDKLFFNLRCGLKIEIDEYNEYTAEKLDKAYEKFVALSDRQKLSGTLRSYFFGGEDGEIRADYSAI